MARGDIGFGAVRTHSYYRRAGSVRIPQLVHGADAGQQQCGDPCGVHGAGDGLDPFQVGVGAESVYATRSAQSVTVGNLDGVHPGGVERGGDADGLGKAVLMAHRMHTVPQRHITEMDHRPAPAYSTIRSAVALAAEVMMSRLPA